MVCGLWLQHWCPQNLHARAGRCLSSCHTARGQQGRSLGRLTAVWRCWTVESAWAAALLGIPHCAGPWDLGSTSKHPPGALAAKQPQSMADIYQAAYAGYYREPLAVQQPLYQRAATRNFRSVSN